MQRNQLKQAEPEALKSYALALRESGDYRVKGLAIVGLAKLEAGEHELARKLISSAYEKAML